MNAEQNSEIELDTHNDAMTIWKKQKELAQLIVTQRLDIEGKARIGSHEDIFNKAVPTQISAIDNFDRGQVLF